jgi:signal transduction histidine kinase/CheY-like chemotaxis protein/HPt (histidine-containing phosphotransfer) domain-containing protein
MQRFTSLKVIVVFAITLLIITSAYWITSRSLEDLMEIVRESSSPDSVLIKVKEINSDITGAESGVRAFALTQDERYLDPYLHLANSIQQKLDTLRALTSNKPYEVSAIDSISSLMKDKLSVYHELLSISYSQVLESALDKMTDQFPETDSSLKVTDTLMIAQQNATSKKSFFQKIFGSGGPSKKDLKEKADSVLKSALIKENEKSKEKISNVQRTIADIKDKESQQLKRQSEKELVLLDKDRDITHEIENLIRKIEFDESIHIQRKAQEANQAALRSSGRIQMLSIAGAIVLLLLIALIIYDIAKSNLYRKKLAEAKSHAEKLAKIKEEFLANMSHEIRTPLSAILGYTGRMLKTNLNDRQTGYANAIHNSSDHLLSIVNDILDLTKLETDNLRLEKINFNPEVVVREVCDVMKFKADEKNISLRFDCPEIKELIVKGDPMRLKQVLYNLIGNAIKFTEKGKVTVNCISQNTASPETSNSRLLIFIISDTGIGIPGEKLNTIFHQFSQADTSITRKYGGTGLGLNISKRIIELQGGSIAVKSKILEGSEFSFTIPYEVVIERKEDEKLKTEDYGHDKPQTLNLKPQTDKTLSGIKILLAEDTEINRILQKEMLKDLGAIVTETTNGFEVLSELRTNSSQVILMDVQMPGMSGIEAMTEIREKLKSDIPAIAMTANVMQHDLDRYLKAGFNDYITKPFTEKDLAEKILNVLNGRTSSFEETGEKEKVLPAGSLYDLNELQNTSTGNNDFIIRMLKIFLSSAESLLNKAKNNTEEKNWEGLSSNVHRLIPSCRYISVNRMASKLKNIEEICNTCPDELKIKELLSEVLMEYEKVSAALQKEIREFENLKTVNSKQ